MTSSPQRAAFQRPIPVEPMRVRRTYCGGAGIDRWHGRASDPAAQRPEEWFASVTPAVNPGFPEEKEEGLSRVRWQGRSWRLRDLITAFPAPMLGPAHLAAAGQNPGILAKMIDSAQRLSIQVHPDKAFARRYFGSEYGKTECWYILHAAPVQGQVPCLYIGFRPGVTRQSWQRLYQTQDIPGMLDRMHRITPRPGEVWLIEGGVPHAIGPGCRLIELQEPTDYTLRTERTCADGSPLPERLVHQGAGEEGLLECFHYEPMEEAELRRRYSLTPQIRQFCDGSLWQKLAGPPRTECFSMAQARVERELSFPGQGGFLVAVVLDGVGRLRTAAGSQPVGRGEHFFLPAAMGGFALENGAADRPLRVLFCCPPGARALCPEEKT